MIFDHYNSSFSREYGRNKSFSLLCQHKIGIFDQIGQNSDFLCNNRTSVFHFIFRTKSGNSGLVARSVYPEFRFWKAVCQPDLSLYMVQYGSAVEILHNEQPLRGVSVNTHFLNHLLWCYTSGPELIKVGKQDNWTNLRGLKWYFTTDPSWVRNACTLFYQCQWSCS